MDKIKKLEEIAKAIGEEKNIDIAIDNFTAGASLVKEILAELETKRGKVYEVVQETDKLIEKETDIG
jgi:exonuclease VII small subunit